jgi:hypothetical protein
MPVRKYIVDALAGVLVLVTAVYLLAIMGQTLLALFLGACGISVVGGSLLSRQQFLKYRMQLEIFYYVIWFASALLLLVIIDDALKVLNIPVSWPSAWTQLMDAARGLELPVLIFSIIYFSFRPGRPNYYAFVAFLITLDCLLGKSSLVVPLITGKAGMITYITIALAMISFGFYLILGRYAGWKLVVQVASLGTAIVALNTGLTYLHSANILTWLSLPPWWNLLVLASSGFMLASVITILIVYLVSASSAMLKALLVATAVYVLTTLPPETMQNAILQLMYLAVFSIAVWVIVALATG